MPYVALECLRQYAGEVRVKVCHHRLSEVHCRMAAAAELDLVTLSPICSPRLHYNSISEERVLTSASNCKMLRISIAGHDDA